MDEKITYRELMEKVHAMRRDGKRLHSVYLDMLIDEVLDALHQSRDDGNADAVKGVRA